MPELPEVEVIRRGLAPLVAGRTICQVIRSDKPLRLSLSRHSLVYALLGKKIKSTKRRAKYLLLIMDDGSLLCIHLGMSGRLGLFLESTPEAKHDHLRLLLDDSMEIRFNDPRRFGSVQIFTSRAEAEKKLFRLLGPEPFSKKFTPAYLYMRAQSHRLPVKNFLMDNRQVVGIGNIYASEILFAAGIAPLTPANMIDKKDWQRVIENVRTILAKAIKAGGTTISDFVGHSGEEGFFQLSLKVYGRSGSPCLVCGTPIMKIVLSGRSTFFCPRCQV
jgi:formamidopyrimidine-DNA glycosylase